jgi:hypothetical protein
MDNGIQIKVETGDFVAVWEGKHYSFGRRASAELALSYFESGYMGPESFAADEDWIPEGRTYRDVTDEDEDPEEDVDY